VDGFRAPFCAVSACLAGATAVTHRRLREPLSTNVRRCRTVAAAPILDSGVNQVADGSQHVPRGPRCADRATVEKYGISPSRTLHLDDVCWVAGAKKSPLRYFSEYRLRRRASLHLSTRRGASMRQARHRLLSTAPRRELAVRQPSSGLVAGPTKFEGISKSLVETFQDLFGAKTSKGPAEGWF